MSEETSVPTPAAAPALFPSGPADTSRSRRQAPLDLDGKLNPQQLDAVLYEGGPLLIVAGAGSGKTRVLTYRLAHLIRNRGQEPGRILAVTFTNKAATEMKERVAQLVGATARGLWIGTFHAVCARILRVEIEKMGYNPNFVVFDDGDQQATMRDTLRALNIDTDTHDPRMMLIEISKAKESLVSADDYQRSATTPSDRTNARIYTAYQERLRANNALDFDDLIFLTVRLFLQNADVLAKYQERFQQILVDEFQDVNYAQYRLIQLLAQRWRNVTCVGDDDQSIYGWRGADVGLILRFEHDFSDARVIKLEQNYRSTSGILDCANLVVKNNRTRRPKELWTENPEGDPIYHLENQDERDESRRVLDRIQQEIRAGRRQWKDFGILYRTNAQSRVFEEAMRSYQVPYRMVGGQRFYERKEIKDIISYLRVLFNPDDRPSTLRALAAPSRGIGPASIEHLTDFAQVEHISLWAAMLRADEVPGLSSRARTSSLEFARTIQEFRRLQESLRVTELIEKILDRTGYLNDLRSQDSREAEDRIQNVHELMNTARQFERESEDPSLRAFLETLSLASDLDTYQEGDDAVTLMTLHSAKGLEFPVVFLVGLEEGLFPSQRSQNTKEGLEEERRLCYVGVTRARERLYVSHAASRMINGSQNRTRPSRFLGEMQASLVRDNARPAPAPNLFPGSLFPSGTERARRYELERGLARPGKIDPAGPTPAAPATPGSSFPAPTGVPAGVNPFKPGDRVRHATIGVGVVVGADAETVRIAFEGQGIKKFQVDVAPIEKVERRT